MFLYAFSGFRKELICGLAAMAAFGVVFGCGGGGGGGPKKKQTVNALPTASISSPEGTIFKEGENIVFSGSGADKEDGKLKGQALVWASNIDGQIGTGATFTTSALSPGKHEITLSAEDSQGDARISEPVLINIAQTRFIKISPQTAAGLTDAANAFDGDHDTAATILGPDPESGALFFKAHMGTEPVFFFNIKLGGTSVSGLSLIYEALDTNEVWQRIGITYLYKEKTVTIQIPEAAQFAGPDGYIHLRAFADHGEKPEEIAVHEIWRVDPVHPGTQSVGIKQPEAAFDHRKTSAAVITAPWNADAPAGEQNFLHFKAYVGVDLLQTFTFNLSHKQTAPLNTLSIDVQDPGSGDWTALKALDVSDEAVKTVSIPEAQTYVDQFGYIHMRASWLTTDPEAPQESLEIYDIRRNDRFILATMHEDEGWIFEPTHAIDGNPNTVSIIYYFWGEFGHYDFLHLKAYAGDASTYRFSIKAGPSAPEADAVMIVDGELEKTKWSTIQRIDLDETKTTTIELLNARPYIDANGMMSIRVRWESGSLVHDAEVYEVWQEVN